MRLDMFLAVNKKIMKSSNCHAEHLVEVIYMLVTMLENKIHHVNGWQQLTGEVLFTSVMIYIKCSFQLRSTSVGFSGLKLKMS